MKISLVLGTFRRDHLLELGLASIVRQNVKNLEILVLNNGDDTSKSRRIAEQAGAGYFWNDRNIGSARSLNLGVQKATGDVVILSNAEMYHIGNTIAELVEPMTREMAIRTTGQWKSDDGSFLMDMNDANYAALPLCRINLPVLMACFREDFLHLGGFDEEFIAGGGFDDDDLMRRFEAYGRRLVVTQAKAVHLFHPRPDWAGWPKLTAQQEHNRLLFESKKCAGGGRY